MTNTKMLQTLIDGQASLRKDVRDGQKGIRNDMEEGFKKVNNRIDALGKQLNVLDEDAPTGEEINKLDTRVKSLERRIASN